MSQPPSGRSSRGRRVFALLAATGAVLAGIATVGAASAAPTGTPATSPAAAGASGASGVTRAAGAAATAGATGAAGGYAIPQANCARPTPGHKACFSIRLVTASREAPGAKPLVVTPAAGPAGGYTPADLAGAYGYNPSAAAGASQTVAIVDAFDDPDALSELNAYDAQFGLPDETSTSFRKVNQAGASSPLPSEDDGWAGEIALDIESVRAVCNKCQILLLEADSTSNADLATAVNTAASMRATEISNSYGGPESVNGTTTSDPSELAAYNHPGIVITASAGDDGWYDWDLVNQGIASDNAPSAPASYPTVVGVGGTRLTLNADGTRRNETVWNENGKDDQVGLANGASIGASGGGCSSLYAAPGFQGSVANYAKLGCASGKRAVNDVSADADPQTGLAVFDPISFPTGTGWGVVGGTSLSSPLISAMWALAGGAGGVSNPSRNLYDHFRTSPSALFDVKTGSNAFCGGDTPAGCEAAVNADTNGQTDNPNDVGAGLLDCDFNSAKVAVIKANRLQCNAAAGYDGPSGVGTPKGLSVFRPIGPSIAATWPAFIKRGATATFRARAFSDPVSGARAAKYVWKWGDGKTTTTTNATATHRFTAQGRPTVSLHVIDTAGHAGASVSKRFVIGFAPSVKISGPTSVRKGKTGTFRAKASDPDTGGKITSHVWRIGSKTVGRGSTLTHRFTAKGTFKVTLTVKDNSGLSKKSNTITVRVR